MRVIIILLFSPPVEGEPASLQAGGGQTEIKRSASGVRNPHVRAESDSLCENEEVRSRQVRASKELRN